MKIDDRLEIWKGIRRISFFSMVGAPILEGIIFLESEFKLDWVYFLTLGTIMLPVIILFSISIVIIYILNVIKETNEDSLEK